MSARTNVVNPLRGLLLFLIGAFVYNSISSTRKTHVSFPHEALKRASNRSGYEARWNNIRILVNPLRGLGIGRCVCSTIMFPLRGNIMSRLLTKFLGERAQMAIRHRRCLFCGKFLSLESRGGLKWS